MSSETVDRYGDIIVQDGLDISRFNENPVALLFHNSRSWPCGNWSNVNKLLAGRPKRTEGTLNFMAEGVDPDADRAAAHVAAGTLRTVSIGFSPNWDDVELILDDDGDYCTGLKYNSSELLECSVVPIPAQPDALIRDAGGDFKLARNLIEEVLDTWTRTPEGLLIPLDEYRRKHLDLAGNPHSVLLGDSAITIKDGAISVDDVRDALRLPAIAKAASEDDPEMDVDPEDPEDPEDDPDEEAAKAASEAAAAGTTDAETPEDGAKAAEAEAKTFVEFLAKAVAGDTFSTFFKLEGAKATEKGVMLHHNGEAASNFTFKDRVRKQHREMIAARMTELAAPKEPVVEPAAKSIVLDIDVEPAEKKLNAISALADAVGAKLARIFGTKEVPERVEPVIVEPKTVEPVAPAPIPTDDEMASAIAKAATTRARLVEKGLIDA